MESSRKLSFQLNNMWYNTYNAWWNMHKEGVFLPDVLVRMFNPLLSRSQSNGNRAPCLWRIYWPLNKVGESRTVVGSGSIVSAYSIKEIVVRRYAHSSSPFGHGCTHAPLVGVRIEALHRSQAWAAISTTNCKQSEKLKQIGLKWWQSCLIVWQSSWICWKGFFF